MRWSAAGAIFWRCTLMMAGIGEKLIISGRVPEVILIKPGVFANERSFSTDYYAPEHERCIRWVEPEVHIAWPKSG
ncbi:MAG: dTDP-4-dehydrorhamnose 3,5-epimerase [Nitrosospira sp.]|nr:dTDP-4-dehydrorhamnose 3,5-epimerase [Nitrosospira sp.]